MRWAACAAIPLLLEACGQAQSKPQLSEQEIAKIRQAEPGILESCIEKVRWGGLDAFPKEIDQCFEMTPRQRWRGLWRDDFEGSLFCPAPATKCENTVGGLSETAIWFDYQLPQPGGKRTGPTGGLYAVEFIGRRTAKEGHFGHMGVFDHQMEVDRMLSVRQLEAPWKPTKAELEVMKEQCRKMAGCSVEQLEKANMGAE